MKTVTIYTDGSCSPNPGCGGWAALLLYKSPNGQLIEKVITGNARTTTNNRMELTAVIMALIALKEDCEVHLYTDSQLVQQGITEWMPKWKRNNWRGSNGGIKNVDLWKSLHAETLRHHIIWHWVRGHAGDAYNERVDKLAVSARENQFS